MPVLFWYLSKVCKPHIYTLYKIFSRGIFLIFLMPFFVLEFACFKNIYQFMFDFYVLPVTILSTLHFRLTMHNVNDQNNMELKVKKNYYKTI